MAVTINDVAKRAGVSVATVSRVINGVDTVNETLSLNVRRAIEELGYVPNSIAQSLKQNCSKMIGITASDMSISSFPELIRNVEEAFLPKSYATIVSSTYDNPEYEENIFRQMAARQVDALVVHSTGQNEDMLNRIACTGTPVILYDRRPRKRLFHSVYSDKKQSMYLAYQHLAELGHKRIMLSTGARTLASNYDRYMGVQRFIFDNELDPANFSYIFNAFSYATGVETMKTIMDMEANKRPTAIVSGSTAITAGILIYCKQNGILVPRDLSLISTNSFLYDELFDLRLTYFEGNERLLADNVVKLLERCFESDKPLPLCDIPLEQALHIGNSTAEAPS